MLSKFNAVLAGGATSMFAGAIANAHVSVSSGPAFADTTQIVEFGVGHGCEGADTQSVRIEIPAEVLSVRAVPSDLGPASVELDDAGLVTAVTWEKPDESVLEADTQYYSLKLRLRVPNQPFSTLYFPAYQVCRTADGDTLEVAWDAEVPESEVADGEEPAPALSILPKRVAGWNKFTLPVDVPDLDLFFSDARIVWKGEAAYSANPSTAELIAGTPAVTALTELSANDEIWVKY